MQKTAFTPLAIPSGYPIRALGAATVGRDPSNVICIDDASVSSRHAQVMVEGDTLVLIDVGSTNGTSVSGRRIGVRERCPLASGTLVHFASCGVRLSLDGDALVVVPEGNVKCTVGQGGHSVGGGGLPPNVAATQLTEAIRICQTCHAPIKPGEPFCGKCGAASVSPKAKATIGLGAGTGLPWAEAAAASGAGGPAPNVQVEQVRLVDVPAQRRQVLVCRAGAAASTPSLAKKAGWATAAGVVGAVVAGPIGAGLGAAFGSWLGGRGGPKAAPDRAGCMVLPLEIFDASIRFPPGHPIDGHAYALHPMDDKRYLGVERFHRELFEEKFHELLNLLVALKASRVRVTCITGYGMESATRVGAEAEDASVAAGRAMHASRDAGASTERLYEPSGEPTTPSNLLWFNSEPTWQQLAEDRLRHRMRHASGTLQYAESFWVNKELSAWLGGVGLSYSSNFGELEQTTWEYEVEFPY
jgi:pSer/pThr/pTyr-binding forkhead associated (FHA) protein